MSNSREESLTLEILEAIEARNDVTQRHLADRLGIALGLANSYMKRCARKGLIKIRHAPANRYLYYLTPKGFAEKSRLTKEYLSASFDFYRSAGSSLSAIFDECRESGAHRIIFAGVSELAEIGSLRAQDYQFEHIGTYDPYSKLDNFLRRPVWHDLSAVSAFDFCIFTALTHTGKFYRELDERLSADQWKVPDILDGLIRRPC